jgi:glycosyltransferase involved in cell wall biosynthesis
MTAKAFLAGHIVAAAADFEVSLVANGEDVAVLREAGLAARLLPAPICRQVSPWRDLHALWVLYRQFRQGRFDIVHSISPKAGLLAMLAASLARVPHRIHTFTGQVWVTRTGWRRWLLKQFDRLLATLATYVLVDSPSQLAFLRAEGILRPGKGEVIGKGSICGVDGQRFSPDAAAALQVRREVGVDGKAALLLFLGRIKRDKGVFDLTSACCALARRRPDVRLLMVGPDEEGLTKVLAGLAGPAQLIHVGYTDMPQRYMAAADVLCLPSYREGFGMVVIEAAVVGLPAVASRIYGITDAVAEGETGLLHVPGDVAGIESALERLIADPDLRRAMGAAARERALRDFSMERVSAELMAFYGKILA